MTQESHLILRMHVFSPLHLPKNGNPREPDCKVVLVVTITPAFLTPLPPPLGICLLLYILLVLSFRFRGILGAVHGIRKRYLPKRQVGSLRKSSGPSRLYRSWTSEFFRKPMAWRVGRMRAGSPTVILHTGPMGRPGKEVLGSGSASPLPAHLII